MTATLITFPTMFEKDAIEFDRKGASNYTRAFGEAVELWDAVVANGDREELTLRVNAFAYAVEHLARYRAEVLGDLVIMNDGAYIELAIIPDLLKAMMLVPRRKMPTASRA